MQQQHPPAVPILARQVQARRSVEMGSIPLRRQLPLQLVGFVLQRSGLLQHIVLLLAELDALRLTLLLLLMQSRLQACQLSTSFMNPLPATT